MELPYNSRSRDRTGDAMTEQSRYVVVENIERFEAILRAGPLDAGQTETVRSLLCEARADLAQLDRAAASVASAPSVREQG